jgi:hypothetical protein
VPELHSVLLFLHILFAATWLGAALWAAGDVKRTLALGRPHTDALAARTRPALSLDLWSGLGTLVSGLVLIPVVYPGMPEPGIIVGLVAVLVRLALLGAAVMPAFRRLEKSVAAGDLAGAAPAAKRLGMLSGIAHLLWLVALAGMVFRG